MELHEAIEKRRTIRIFKQGATEAQLRKLLAAGAKAPSSRNKQSWEFILIEDQKLTQMAAAKVLGVTQPRVSDLVRGKIDLFSIDTLVDMLARAGIRVALRIHRSSSRRRPRAA